MLLSGVSPAVIFCSEDGHTSVPNKITLELQLQPRFAIILANTCLFQVYHLMDEVCHPRNESMAQETCKTSKVLPLDRILNQLLQQQLCPGTKTKQLLSNPVNVPYLKHRWTGYQQWDNCRFSSCFKYFHKCYKTSGFIIVIVRKRGCKWGSDNWSESYHVSWQSSARTVKPHIRFWNFVLFLQCYLWSSPLFLPSMVPAK